MHSTLQDRIRQMLAGHEVVGVLGLREHEGAVAPHVFTAEEDTARLVVEPKWPLAKTGWMIVRSLPAGKALGLVCRGCDIRAIEELVRAEQIRPGALRTIGISCSAGQAEVCLCETPFVPGEEPSVGVDPMSMPAVRRLCRDPDRLNTWREHFRRCIKCYGCRNSCPICVCPACKLEDDGYVTTGMVPPDPLAFHLIRTMHLADRCVGCGACQDSCPSGLPLLSLHLAMRRALRERTGNLNATGALSLMLTASHEDGTLWEDTLGSGKPGGGEYER